MIIQPGNNSEELIAQIQNVVDQMEIPLTDNKGKPVKLSQARLNQISSSGKFWTNLQSKVKNILISKFSEDLHKEEETSSKLTFSPSYKGLSSIEEQVSKIATIFNLDPQHALKYCQNLPQLPEGADGFVVRPLASAIIGTMPSDTTYSRAVNIGLDKISAQFNLVNYRENSINSRYLRQHDESRAIMEMVKEEQKGGILIIPARLGPRKGDEKPGKSPSRARETFLKNVFALDTLTGISIALTHPALFSRLNPLQFCFCGDRYSLMAQAKKNEFDYVPSLCTEGYKIALRLVHINDFKENYRYPVGIRPS